MTSGIWPSSTDVPLLFRRIAEVKQVLALLWATSWVTLRRPLVP